jgi:hypothetical protein
MHAIQWVRSLYGDRMPSKAWRWCSALLRHFATNGLTNNQYGRARILGGQQVDD